MVILKFTLLFDRQIMNIYITCRITQNNIVRLDVRYFEIKTQLLFSAQSLRKKRCLIEFKLYLKSCLGDSCMRKYFFHR